MRTGTHLGAAAALLDDDGRLPAWMVALARATVAEHTEQEPAARSALLDMLGLDADTGGPRVRLADLPADERPDLEMAPRDTTGDDAT